MTNLKGAKSTSTSFPAAWNLNKIAQPSLSSFGPQKGATDFILQASSSELGWNMLRAVLIHWEEWVMGPVQIIQALICQGVLFNSDECWD